MGGVPDVWYSGKKKDLWLEYKFIPKIPSKPETLITPALSQLQLAWLEDRHAEGRNVGVVVGSPKGGVVMLNKSWECGISSANFCKSLMSRKELATWVYNAVML